uniref:Kinetochore protein SPC25 n=1 Tax=Parastrongyloides trichosuri TaxID=131310 RepID=A0A0N4ZGA1_PARTI
MNSELFSSSSEESDDFFDKISSTINAIPVPSKLNQLSKQESGTFVIDDIKNRVEKLEINSQLLDKETKNIKDKVNKLPLLECRCDELSKRFDDMENRIKSLENLQYKGNGRVSPYSVQSSVLSIDSNSNISRACSNEKKNDNKVLLKSMEFKTIIFHLRDGSNNLVKKCENNLIYFTYNDDETWTVFMNNVDENKLTQYTAVSFKENVRFGKLTGGKNILLMINDSGKKVFYKFQNDDDFNDFMKIYKLI